MRVVNVRELGGVAAAAAKGVVYCGRPTAVGNPFVVGRDGTRDEVIAKFRRLLWSRVKSGDAATWAFLRSLQSDSLLGCWCSPLPCHCDVLVRCWEYLKSEGRV